MIISYQTDYDRVCRHALAMCQVPVPSACVSRFVCKHAMRHLYAMCLDACIIFSVLFRKGSRVSERDDKVY